jgi:DNA-binding LacI/PurR family transcriptional regulator
MARVASPFYAVVLREFSRKLQDVGYRTLLLNIEYGHRLEEALPTALQYQVDGIVITSATLSSQMAESCVRAGTPVVMFNRYEPGNSVNTVCCDNVGGGRLVANTLIEAGHTRFAHIAGDKDSSTNRDREKGFTDRLRECGHVLQFREGGDNSYQSGYRAATRLLQADNLPDAIFCTSDLMALGAIDAARIEFHLNVPDDLSIIGFDDIDMASWPIYSLTTVRQSIGRMVNVAIDVLLDAIVSPEGETVIKLIPGELVRRGSVRTIRTEKA